MMPTRASTAPAAAARLAAVLAAITAGTLAGCGDDDAGLEPPAPTPFSPLGTEGAHFRDAEGRTVILRGVNARIEGVFDVTLDGGRVPLEDIPELTLDDCARMAELGWNVLRLPINWSGIEPQRDQIDEAYLVAVDAAIECAWGAGVYVLVDFHQDAYSKEIGEDGAPLWAIVPPPEMLLEGPLDDLTERRTSPQVLAAFDSFFELGDPNGLQAEFFQVVELVATRYAEHPGVVGLEIFNEPQAPAEELYPFEFEAARRIRAVAPKKLFFYEPPVVRNLIDSQPLSDEPSPVSGGVYAPHIYTIVSEPFTIEDLRGSNDNARAEADAWATPLFIGEFGSGPDPFGYRYLGFQYDLQDEYLASSALWLWKEESQGSWGLFAHDPEGDVWTERPEVVATVARPYAQRIAGTPTRMAWLPDGAGGGTLTVAFEVTTAIDAPSVIAVPSGYAVAGATCDGAVVAAVAPIGAPARRVEVACGAGVAGAHTIVVTLVTE